MWAVGMGVPSALPCLPNPTVALYLFGSCFGDWVGLDWSQGCVQSFTLPHLHTPSNTLSLLSAPPQPGARTTSYFIVEVPLVVSLPPHTH